MKSLSMFIAVFVSSIFSSTVYSRAAMTTAHCNEAESFVGMTGLETTVVKLGVQARDSVGSSSGIQRLEAGKIQAIRATAAVPSLEGAMKDFVVTSREYLEGIEPRTDEMRITYDARIAALQTRMDRASENIHTELQLACH